MYEITVKTTSCVNDLLSDFLILKGSESIVIDKWESDVVSYYIILKAYFPDDYNVNYLKSEIITYLETLRQADLDIGAGEVIINTLEEIDWENDWKKYFTVFHVGKNLVIKPIWCEYEKQEKEVVIDFDSGSFFGATPHPSTRLCLEEIEELASTLKDKESCNILDLGSGSGILSLALHHLGLTKITAIDIDPVAIRATKDNFEINKMASAILLEGEIKDCKETFDFIAGNLLAEIIVELAQQISLKLNKNGIFICAGITKEKEAEVEKTLSKVGIKVVKKRYQDEWVLIRGIKN